MRTMHTLAYYTLGKKVVSMSGYIKGIGRKQSTLLPECLDDFIHEEHFARVIDAFVDRLGMGEMNFKHYAPKDTGRPGYDPRDLLKLYLYGYMNRVRSSRELEKQCQRNIEVMWLIGRLAPDFKTIADFRKDNRQAVVNLFRHFVLWCRTQHLIGSDLISIDGSKFKAVNSPARNLNEDKLNDKLRHLDKRIEDYLTQLDQADERDQGEPINREAIAQSLAHLQANRAQAQTQLEQLRHGTEKQISLTDADARAMRRGQQSSVVGYNVQTAVDSRHKLIVAVEVCNEGNDRNQLQNIASQAKTNLEQEQLHVVADSGYSNETQVANCVERNIIPALPKPKSNANAARGLYSKEDFRYDASHDCDHCPQGQALTYRSQSNHHGRQVKLYRSDACSGCAAREQCTTNQQKGREIARGIHEHLLEQAHQRFMHSREMALRRKSTSEHPFGTIKVIWNHGHFLMKTLKNVRTEIHLSAIAYNMTRIINIVGVPKLLMRMQ